MSVRPRFGTGALALAATAGLLVAGVVPALAAAPAPAGAVDTAAAVPRLTWTPCGDGLQCATAAVPLDHRRPHGPRITIALAKLPATDPAHRIGSLFLNPGGPGGSGVQFVRAAGAALYSPAVRARFDLVGFDPRFVGDSRPLATCMGDEEFLRTFGGLPAFPVTAAEERATARANARYTAACARRAPFLAYASTANVARDLDLLRQAVGDARLTFAGYSYGSILGQTYAALFPRRIRALTIDGVLDAQAWSTGSRWESRRVPFTVRIDSAPGARDTFGQFTALCRAAGPQRCEFAAGGDPAVKYERLAQRLKVQPVDLGDGFVLGYPDLVSATLGVLYSPTDWKQFAADLESVYRTVFGPPSARTLGAGSELARRAASAPRWVSPAAAPGPRAAPEPPVDTGYAPFVAVACSDTVNPRSAAVWARAGRLEDRRARYFGRSWTWAGEACASWPLPAPGRYLGPYRQRTSAPLLVVGTRFDPATPYSGAVSADRRFPRSALLTIEGYGHTSLAAPSACATAVFDAYTLTGRVPPPGTACRQDVAPFAP